MMSFTIIALDSKNSISELVCWAMLEQDSYLICFDKSDTRMQKGQVIP